MGLLDIIEAVRDMRRERDTLGPMLMESLAKRDIKKAPKADTWFGPSRLPTLCPKAIVLAHRLDVDLLDEVTLKARWRIDRGTAFHMIMQELWLGPMGYLLGGWQCPRCAHIHGGVPGVDRDGDECITVTFASAVPMPEGCEKCQLKAGKWKRFRFVEPEFKDHDLLILGMSDGLLHMAPNPLEVMDIKTTGTPLDKSSTTREGVFIPSLREAPRENDASQLQWYMDASGTRSGRLVYMSTTAETLDIAEHKVAYNPAYIHAQKEMIRGLREALKEKSRPVPPCPFDGKGSYGECNCVEVAMFWARSGR